MLNEAGKFSWRLRGDGLDISLKDEEVLCFDKNVVGDESGIVDGICHDSIIETILGCASGGNATKG